MKDLIIPSVGIHALEMAEIVERINRASPTWNLRGFLTRDGQERADKTIHGYPILGTARDIGRFADCWFVPDNERPVELPMGRVGNIVDPSAFVSRTARLGVGCVIYPHCYVGANAVLGDRVFVLAGAVINHDDRLDDDVVLCANVSLAGSVHVEAGCYIGQACTVRQRLRIGRGSFAGTGAVVVKDVPSEVVVVGNPARVLRARKVS
jgi:acetyltransferase-like isoleucine patch superfamily enzyme